MTALNWIASVIGWMHIATYVLASFGFADYTLCIAAEGKCIPRAEIGKAAGKKGGE